MAYCTNCGAQMEDSALFCTACGAQVPPQQENPNTGFYDASHVDTPQEVFLPEDVESHKLMAVLSYFGILVLVPFFCAKDSAYVRFHMNQGIVLLIASVVMGLVGALVPLAWVINLAILVFRIVGIVWAVQGKAKELPLIGSIKIYR